MDSKFNEAAETSIYIIVETVPKMNIDSFYSDSQVKTSSDPATFISLFSGCGGMDLGFIGGFDFLGKRYPKTGFVPVWANEISSAACRTYRQNIGEIAEGDIRDAFNKMPEYADVVIGGFMSGKMKGLDGERSILYEWMVKAVDRIRPKAFVAENVGSLLMDRHREACERILADFQGLGYNVSLGRYRAEWYGVPQTRDRVLIVGTAEGVPAFQQPAPVTADCPLTAFDALHDLEDRDEDPAFAHVWSRKKLGGDQGSRILKADRPGYTVTAECHGNSPFHYSLPRRISLREQARIQSFPDTFTFPCGIRDTERQIGNAVPPVLAWHAAMALKKCLA